MPDMDECQSRNLLPAMDGDEPETPPTDFNIPRRYFRGRGLFPELTESRQVLFEVESGRDHSSVTD